jgi:hypothetical protein
MDYEERLMTKTNNKDEHMTKKEKEVREILNTLLSISGDEYYEQAVKDIMWLFK